MSEHRSAAAIDDRAGSRRRAAVELRHAAAVVGGNTVWEGIDLCVGPGELAAVLGPNGVGKSTMLKVILGLLPLASGEARVLGEAPGAVSRRIGYLPQRRSFDGGLRVRGVDIVRLGLDGHRWGLPRPWSGRTAIESRVAGVVDLVGATAYAHRPIGELSGGEQQRLLIAQALAPQPELLLLDEPLDSLDPANQQAVATLIGRICREQGVTVVMVAHDVNPILAYLDHVVYLASAGAVSGPPADVITAEKLSRLYDAPIEVLKASDGRLVVVGQPEPPAHHTDRHAR